MSAPHEAMQEDGATRQPLDRNSSPDESQEGETLPEDFTQDILAIQPQSPSSLKTETLCKGSMTEEKSARAGPSSSSDGSFRTCDRPQPGPSSAKDPESSTSSDVLLTTYDIPHSKLETGSVQLKIKGESVVFKKDPSPTTGLSPARVLGVETETRSLVQEVKDICGTLSRLNATIITTSPSLNTVLQKIQEFYPRRTKTDWDQMTAEIYRLINTCERVTPLIRNFISAASAVQCSTLKYERCKSRLLREFITIKILCEKHLGQFKHFLSSTPSSVLYSERPDMQDMRMYLFDSIEVMEEVLLEMEDCITKLKRLHAYPVVTVGNEDIGDSEDTEDFGSFPSEKSTVSSSTNFQQRVFKIFEDFITIRERGSSCMVLTCICLILGVVLIVVTTTH